VKNDVTSCMNRHAFRDSAGGILLPGKIPVPA
jgi:hypothetical protein